MYCTSCGVELQDEMRFCNRCGAVQAAATPAVQTVTGSVSPQSRVAATNDIVYAGFWRRWAALFIDQLVLGIPLVIVAILLAIPFGLLSHGNDETAGVIVQGIYYLLWLVAAPLYYAFQESSSQQATLGKRALGIKVTDRSGNRISFANALGRWFAAALSYITLYIGFLMAAFTERKQGLHDMIAGTLVTDRWAFTEYPERQKRGLSGCLVVFIIGIVVIIPLTAILAAIAISQYQDYVIRSQVSEGSSLIDGTKTAVVEYLNNNNAFPSENAAAGLAPPDSIAGNYVSSVEVGSDGTITARYSSTPPQAANVKIDGKVLAFKGVLQGDSIEWVCNSSVGTTIDNKYRPSTCRD